MALDGWKRLVKGWRGRLSAARSGDRRKAGRERLGETRRAVAWIETVIVSLAAVTLASAASPEDPFLLHTEFPWLLIAPVFLALRHGFAFGFLAAFFLIALVTAAWSLGWNVVTDFPARWVLGVLIVTMLAGEFSDLWQRRLARIEFESDYRDRRMEEFTRSYHLLKVAHDQLVEQLAGAAVSLRQAISALREEMREKESAGDPLASVAETMLALFRRYAAVQTASLHRVQGEEIDARPLARLGSVANNLGAVAASPIVNDALRAGEMMSVLADENGAPRYAAGDILAVAPIRGISRKTWAALVIYRIPFLKFTEENLSLIAVMAAYMGDVLDGFEKDRQAAEGRGERFLVELRRCNHYARRFGVHARVAAVELADDHLLDELIAQRRSVDDVWPRRNRQRRAVVLWLMPFTDDYGAAGFQARISLWARQRLAADDSGEPVRIRVFPVNGRRSTRALMEEIEHACDLVDC